MTARGISAFATITTDGKPRVRYVCAVMGDDFKIRFATFADSHKVAEIKKNPNVHLTCGELEPKIGTYLQIDATVSITDSQEERENMWYEHLGVFFKGGVNDPNYVVMVLDPSRIEVYGRDLKAPEVWVK